MTITTLTRRLTMHLQSGSIKNHSHDDHDVLLQRSMLVERTKILRIENDFRRLIKFEALLILEKRPALNIQTQGMHRILQLFE